MKTHDWEGGEGQEEKMREDGEGEGGGEGGERGRGGGEIRERVRLMFNEIYYAVTVGEPTKRGG